MTFTSAEVVQLVVTGGAMLATIAVLKNDIAWIKRAMHEMKEANKAANDSVKLDVRELRKEFEHTSTVVLSSHAR